MRRTLISKGGQVSIPAEVRHRWKTNRIAIEDQGSLVVIRPIPDDPIGAAIGSLRGGAPTTDELRTRIRDEEAEIDAQRERSS